MTGAQVNISQTEKSYEDLVVNPVLNELMQKNLEKVGFDNFTDEDEIPGSTDIGNVSHKAPTFYGNIGMGKGKAKVHEQAFLEYANSVAAKEKMIMAVRAFAYSALEVSGKSELMEKVKTEFVKSKSQ